MISGIIRLLANALGLWAAANLLNGFHLPDTLGWQLIAIALILTIANAIVRPLLNLLSAPLILLTLGLFLLVTNTAMLFLTEWVSDAFTLGLSIDSFSSGMAAAVIIAVINWLISAVFPERRTQPRAQARR